MRVIKSLLVVATLALPVAAGASTSTWDIDTSHTNIGFTVKHMMVSNVRGEFGKVTGTITLNEADVSKSKVSANIESASIDTRDAKRDEHLRAADFFDAAKYPAITFNSKSVKKVAGGYEIAGDLTMRGVTKPVVLKAGELSAEVKDPWGGTRRGITATTVVNRKDFGMVWNAALDNGGVVLGEEVTINLELELVKKAPAKT